MNVLMIMWTVIEDEYIENSKERMQFMSKEVCPSITVMFCETFGKIKNHCYDFHIE